MAFCEASFELLPFEEDQLHAISLDNVHLRAELRTQEEALADAASHHANKCAMLRAWEARRMQLCDALYEREQQLQASKREQMLLKQQLASGSGSASLQQQQQLLPLPTPPPQQSSLLCAAVP